MSGGAIGPIVTDDPGAPPGGPATALLDEDETDRLRHRWLDVQGRFVDDPRGAVEDADRLVEDTIEAIADVFRRQREQLEDAWQAGGQATTEDLRQALRRYRVLFDDLLRDPLGAAEL